MSITCRCGVTFEATHPRAKYCSARCRKQASRNGGVVHELTPRADEPVRGVVEAEVVRELEEVGVLRSALGAQCVSLASRIDHPGADTGSAVAAVSRQLTALMEQATRAAKHGSSQQLRDELAERRRKHA